MTAKKKSKNDITFNVSKAEINRLKKSKSFVSTETLAERSDRLLATLIDFSPYILGAILSSFFSNYRSLIDGIFGVLLNVMGFINLCLLWSRGQTIGKYFRSIKIVNYKTDQILDWATLLFLRPLLIYILFISFIIAVIGGQPQYSLVPALLILVDFLFIYRSDRRCFHDLISGSKVVNELNSGSFFVDVQKSAFGRFRGIINCGCWKPI